MTCHSTDKKVDYFFCDIFRETMWDMVHSKRGEISKAAMNTTLLLTFVKREEKISFGEISMYRNTDKSKNRYAYFVSHKNRHHELRVFVMFVNALFKTRRFVCELPLTF